MLRLNNLKRSLQPFLRRLNSSRPPSAAARRPFCSVPNPPPTASSDAEFRRYVGYAILFLGCGAVTYYSFPFPENAKHKKAELFRYAPLPADLHTVSNWSGTHEIQTRTFLQPENIGELESVVKECSEKKQKIRLVGSGLSLNGIGLTRQFGSDG